MMMRWGQVGPWMDGLGNQRPGALLPEWGAPTEGQADRKFIWGWGSKPT